MPNSRMIAIAAAVLAAAAPALAQKAKNTLRIGFYDPIPGLDLVYDPKGETALTARGVFHTLNFVADPKVKFRIKSRFLWIKKAEKVDRYTVRVTAKGPRAVALARLAVSIPIFPSDVRARQGSRDRQGDHQPVRRAARQDPLEKAFGPSIRRFAPTRDEAVVGRSTLPSP